MESESNVAAAPVDAVVTPKVILVVWRDCETLDGWTDIPTVRAFAEQHRIIQTIGFEIGGDADQVILSSSHESVFGKVSGCWMIPRSQIQEIRRLSV